MRIKLTSTNIMPRENVQDSKKFLLNVAKGVYILLHLASKEIF
jgi:hypothetical protein